MKTKLLTRIVLSLGLATTSAVAMPIALPVASSSASMLLASTRAVLAAAAFGLPMRAYCAGAQPASGGDKGKDEGPMDDIVEMLAKRGKDAMKDFHVDEALNFDARSLFEKLSTRTYEVVSSGAAGQLGFGFMMGFSSGYFVRKVSRVIALLAGGVFCAVQALSYHGYMKVNYDRLKSDVESMMDLNGDGKVDEKDAEKALDQATKMIGFNMPSGGGFTVGLLLGLRS